MARRSTRLARYDENDPLTHFDLDVYETKRKREKKEKAEEARRRQRIDFREPTSAANRMIKDAIVNSDVLQDRPIRFFRNSQLNAQLSEDDPHNEM